VHGIDELRKSFDAFAWRLPFDASPVIRDEGLVLGHGTVLARMGRNRRGEDSLALDEDQERFLALLSAVCGRQISPRAMHHVARASEQWRRGDKVLAQIELAFARFPRLETRDDAFRLFLAEDLLGRGFSPRRLMRELGFDPSLLKYNDEELRNPPGEGKLSGEWARIQSSTSSDDVSSALQVSPGFAVVRPQNLSPLVDALAPVAGEWLAAFALRATAVTAFLSLLLIPTPEPGGIFEGDVPGLSGVRYRLLGPQGRVEITATGDRGATVTVEGRQAPEHLFVDTDGRVIGRTVATGVYLDIDAITAAMRDKLGTDPEDEPGLKAELAARSNEPRLCPDPSLELRGRRKDGTTSSKYEFADIYQEYVGSIINREVRPPLPAAFGFALSRPGPALSVVFDHCRLSTGDMIEAKGHFEDVLQYDWGRKSLAKEWIAQATRQIEAADANGGRRIEWHFYEKASMEFARQAFKDAEILDRIQLVHTDYPGDSDWPYPESIRRTWAKGRQKP
jgi:hypothetical protein